MAFSRTEPYNDLPLLPPEADIESREILKKCITARSALSALKQAGDLIPDQSVLINSIPILEAKVSSEIENIVTTTDELFKFVSGTEKKTDAATKETSQYYQALYQGYLSIKERPVCASTAVEICRTIRNIDIDIRKVPGTSLKNPATEEIVYTPPTGESVIRDKLSNLEKFINNETGIEPLVRMAVMHYQFEAIHPFTDGNGRTGRILNILFLVQEDILDIPVLYLSRFFLKHRKRYYSLLRKVTEDNNWQDWILYVLEAVEETAGWTTDKINTIDKLRKHTCDFVSKQLPKIYSHELVDAIFEQPYCRISNLVDKDIAKRQTASAYLKKLVEIGVLKPIRAGREVLYFHSKFLNLLKQDGNSFEPYGDEFKKQLTLFPSS